MNTISTMVWAKCIGYRGLLKWAFPGLRNVPQPKTITAVYQAKQPSHLNELTPPVLPSGGVLHFSQGKSDKRTHLSLWYQPATKQSLDWPA